ncbi:MAG: ATP-binding cassette domain-containing protein [Lachnospiraceae bacterium]|nr:ATP-binding cassette domain-containing protein [Lachnospiraceae bacterium]
MELKIVELTKTYGRKRALGGINMTLTPGVYGLLGPNGSGKTTLLSILTDNLSPTSGEVYLDGSPIHELGARYRKRIGYMPQHQGVYPGFTLGRFMHYMAALKGLKKIEAGESIEKLVGLVDLSDHMKVPLEAFSGGMKQRALLAQALLGNPDIILLDEPTAGLDPEERINVRNIVSDLGNDRIVVMATHIISDLSFGVKKLIFLKEGQIIHELMPGEIGEACPKTQTEVSPLEEVYLNIYGKTDDKK